MTKRNRPATAMLAMLVLTVLLSGGLASRVVAAELSAAPPEGPIKGSVRHAFILSDSGRGKVLRYDAEAADLSIDFSGKKLPLSTDLL